MTPLPAPPETPSTVPGSPGRPTVPAPSYSALTRFRECPQAWNYAHVRRLGLDRSDPARDFGSWWHALRAMDSIDRGTQRGTLVWCPSRISTGAGPTLTRIGGWTPSQDSPPAAPQWLLTGRNGTRTLPTGARTIVAVAAAWWRSLDEDTQAEWTDHLGGTLQDRLIGLDQRWRARWSEDTDQEDPLGVEVPFPITLDGPGWPGQLRGVVDEIYLDRKRGLLVQRDHKTHRVLQTEEGIGTLMDSQHYLYARGVSAMTREVLGRDIEAIGYDRIRVAPPKTPQLTRSGTLSKSVTDYDVQTYIDWVGDGVAYPGLKKDGSGAGVYQLDEAVVAKLSDPAALSAWHQRTLQPINAQVQAEHWRSARDTYAQTVEVMVRITETGAAPRNFDRFKCNRCDFRQLCYAEMIGGPDGDYPLDEYGLTSR